MYDLIVIGGGPIGSFLAKKFSENKNKVLLIEKNLKGTTLKCSGHISKELSNFTPIKKEFIENKIRGAIFHNKNKKYLVDRKKEVSYVINRQNFDKFLFKKAKKAGVDIKKETFVNFEEKKDRIIIKTNKNTYESKLLAGCDGPLSLVRKKAKIKDPKKFLLGIFTKVDKPSSNSFVEIFLDESPDFFAWKIPRGKSIEYGIASKNKEKIHEYLLNFSKKENFEIKELYGGLIPLIPPKKIISNRVFLCGDAAAQVKPFSGGGIIYGLTSANIASETINPNKPQSLEKYQKEVNKFLKKDIWIGNQIRKIYSLPPSLRTIFLKILEKLPSKVQMDKPSSLFKR